MERVLGQASVDIRANDKIFLRDLERMLKKIKDQSLNAILNVDTKQAEQQLDKFRKDQEKSKPIEIKFKANFNEAKKQINDFKKDQSDKAGTLKFGSSVTFAQARRDIAAFRKEQRPDIILKASVTFAQARRDIKDFRDNQKPLDFKSNLTIDPDNAKTTFDEFKDKYVNSAPVVMNTAMAFGPARSQISKFIKENNNREIILRVDANTNPARKSVRQLENDLAKNPIIAPTMLVNPHTGEVFGKGYNPFEGMASAPPVEVSTSVKADTSDALDSMDVLNRRIQALRNQGIDFPIRVSTDKFDREVIRLEQKLNAYDLGMEILAKPKLTTEDIAIVRRQIQRTAPELGDEMAALFAVKMRSQLTRYAPSIFSSFTSSNGEFSKAMKGFSATMTGVLPFDLVKDNILGFVGGMDAASLSSAVLVGKIGALGAGLTAASGAAINLATDLGQVVGIAALAPAAFAANQIRLWTREMAFAGMSTAIFSQNTRAVQQALSGMSPVMQHTAMYLREYMNELSNATQDGYWDQMGSEIQVTAELLKNSLITNFSRMGEVMALNHIEILKQVVAFQEMGKFDSTFKNIIDAFENMRGGLGSLTRALLTLTSEGSKKLPELGTHFTNLSKMFDDFIQANANNGNIMKWIDVAYQRIGELGSIVGNTVEIIVAVGEAAEAAGSIGLTDLANAFERLSEIVNNTVSKGLMTQLFRDANVAAQNFGEGFGHLLAGLRSSAPEIGRIFISVSKSVKDALSGIGEMFAATGNHTMMNGLVALMEGLRVAMDQLAPSFHNVGEIIGMLGEMGGVVLQTLVPGINTATKMVKVFLEGFHEGFIELVPTLQVVGESFHHMLIEPIRILGEVLGGAMKFIADMPPQFLMLATALGMIAGPAIGVSKAFSFVRDSINGAFDGMSPKMESLGRSINTFSNNIKAVDFSPIATGFKTATSGITASAIGVSSAVGNMNNSIKSSVSATKTNLSSMGSSLASSMLATVGAFDASKNASDRATAASKTAASSWSGAKSAARDAADSIKMVGSGIGSVFTGSVQTAKGAVGGLKTALGGLAAYAPAIGFTVGLAVLETAMADAQRGADQAKKSIEGYAATFDSELNKFGSSAVEHFKSRFEELGRDWGTDLGFANNFKKEMEEAGVSLDKLAQGFQGGKAEVTQYAGSWNHLNEEINKVMSNPWDFKTKAQAAREVWETASNDIIAKTGRTREEILSLNDDAILKLTEGMGQAGKEALEAIEKIKDFRETLEGIKGIDLGSVWDSVNNGGAEMDGVRQALSVANSEALSLDKNFKVIESTTASIADKTRAFQDNLRITGSESLSNLSGGMKEYYSSLEKVNDGFAKVKAGAENGVSSLMTFDSSSGQLVGTFQMQNQAAREFHDTLSLSAKGIQAVAVEAFDAAQKMGKPIPEAIEAAKAAAGPKIEELKTQLRSLGFEEGQIESIVDKMGLLDKDIEMGLNVAGADEAKRQIIETQLAAQALASGDFTTYINIMDQDARQKIEALLGTNGKYDKKTIETALDRKGFDMTYEELMVNIASAKDPVAYVATLEDQASAGVQSINNNLVEAKRNSNIPVQVTGEAQTKVHEITKSLEDMVRDPKNVELTTNARNAADQALAELKRLNTENPGLKLDADIAELENKVNIAKNKVLDVKDRQVVIDAIDKASPIVGHWNTLQPSAKQVVMDIVDNASPKLQGYNQMTMEQKEAAIKAIDEANPKAMAWQSLTLDEKKGILSIHDEATSYVQNFNANTQIKDMYGRMLPQDDVSAAVDSINLNAHLQDKVAELKPNDNVTPNVQAINSLPINDKQAVLEALDQASPRIDGFNQMTMQEKRGVIDAIDQANPKLSAWQNMPIFDKVATLSAMDQANPALSAWNLAPALDKSALLTAVDRASEIQAEFEAKGMDTKTALLDADSSAARAVQEAFDSLPIQDKKALLEANNLPALSSQAEFDNLPIEDKLSILRSDNTEAIAIQRAYEAIQIAGKESKITADNSDARAKVSEANSWSIGDKFFNIAANLTSSARNILNGLGIHFAVGGIIPGNSGIQAFANGGFSDPKVMSSISSFAGGTERHVAQIARGQTPYRVWAEPETGGEAYIPLAKSKRKRSMKILEQVAKYFGMNLMKYNNGGVYRGTKSLGGSVMSYADGGTDLAEALTRDRKNISEGFKSLKLELFSTFGSPEKSPMVRTLDGIQKTLNDFADTYRETAPYQSSRADYVVSLIQRQQKLSSAWSNGLGEDFTADFIAKQARFNENPNYSRKINMGAQWTMADFEKSLSILTKKLSEQKAALEKVISNRDSMQKNIASNLFSTFKVSDVVQSKDNTGWRPPTTAADMARYTRDKLDTIKKYSDRMKSLVRAGYNKAIINDIASMNPEDAIYLADALLSDKSYMNSINSGYEQMFGANGDMNINAMTGDGYIAGLANQTGKFLADSFYQNGIDAQQGLVDGLTKDVSAVERAATVIADSLINTFKSVMGIRSPSRVMKSLGYHIPEGLALGIDSGQNLVSNSMRNIVRPRDINITARPESQSTEVKNSGIIGGTTTAGPIINVYPSQGMSEQQIGQSASRELLYRL